MLLPSQRSKTINVRPGHLPLSFLAVQDSSIGDLVTHSLTDSLSESGFDFRAEQSRAEQSRAEQSRAEQSRADSDLDLGLG